MAVIELVIKIPEGLKKDFEYEHWTALSCMEMKDALENATPLPKGHGRLIDIDLLRDQVSRDEREAFSKHQVWLLLSIRNKKIPTIIEADRSEE